MTQALPAPLHYGTRLQLYRGNNSALISCDIDSRRIVLTRAVKRSRQLVPLENENIHTDT